MLSYPPWRLFVNQAAAESPLCYTTSCQTLPDKFFKMMNNLKTVCNYEIHDQLCCQPLVTEVLPFHHHDILKLEGTSKGWM